MEEHSSLLHDLQTRIQELEDKVEALRISRRVLMNLIDLLEQDKNRQLAALEKENSKLQRSNCRYARELMARNFRIRELEQTTRLGVDPVTGRSQHLLDNT